MLFQRIDQLPGQVQRIVKANLLPRTQVEADGLVLDLGRVRNSYEILVRLTAPLVQPHKEADLVINVLVALRQISNQ